MPPVHFNFAHGMIAMILAVLAIPIPNATATDMNVAFPGDCDAQHDTTTFCDAVVLQAETICGTGSVAACAADYQPVCPTSPPTPVPPPYCSPVAIGNGITAVLPDGSTPVMTDGGPSNLAGGTSLIGHMRVYDNPADPCCGGGYIFGAPWALEDLPSEFASATNELTLRPNFNQYDSADPFWSDGNGHGNKIVEGTTRFEPTLSAAIVGGCVTFAGAVVSNTLADGYSVHAFLRLLFPVPSEPDPFADHLIIAGQQVDITDGGDFLLALCDHGANISGHGPWYSSADRVPPGPNYPPGSLPFFSDPRMTLQAGFTVTGMNANPVNQNLLGSMVVHVTGTDVTDALSCSELSPPSAVVDIGNSQWQSDRNRRGKILLSERSIQIQKRELDLTEVVVGLTFIDSDDACISEVEADINMNPVTVTGVVSTRATCAMCTGGKGKGKAMGGKGSKGKAMGGMGRKGMGSTGKLAAVAPVFASAQGIGVMVGLVALVTGTALVAVRRARQTALDNQEAAETSALLEDHKALIV